MGEPITVPGDLTVRGICQSDHLQWLELWAGYNAFYERVGPRAVPPAVTSQTWQRLFDSYEPVHALVAAIDTQIVGFTHYLFHRNTTMLGPTCYLQDLFVVPAARGKGAGRALIEGVYKKARAAGCSRVYWHTHETNQAAMRLYDQVGERSGFVVYRQDLS